MEETPVEEVIEGKAAPERFRKLVYHICDTICTDWWSPQEFQNMGHFDNFYERFLKEYQDEAVE